MYRVVEKCTLSIFRVESKLKKKAARIKQVSLLLVTGFLRGFLFNPEDEDSIFLETSMNFYRTIRFYIAED
jgi:hypothetical protein